MYFEIAVGGAFSENRRPMPTPEAAARNNPVAKVCIATIQRVYSMLSGQELR